MNNIITDITGTIGNAIQGLTPAANDVLTTIQKYNQLNNQNIYQSNVAQALSSQSSASGQTNLLGMALGNNIVWIILIIALIIGALMVIRKK